MKQLFSILCLMTVIGLTGCAAEYGDRNRELNDCEGKTISEAYLQNNDTLVIRFEDGTMIEVEEKNDKLEVNGQDD